MTRGSESDTTKAASSFTPYRVSSLPVSSHLIVLFCILLNLMVGWNFYAPLLDNGFDGFDDATWRRDAARRNTFATIFDPTLRTGHEAMDTSYVPVQSVLYHLSINQWQQDGWPIRVMGIWTHLINAVLVLLLTFRFTGSIPGAHAASLAFLIWPRNASTTGWLCASLAHGLVLMLYLLAFLLMQTFLHKQARGEGRWLGWWRLLLAVALFALAVLTKELGATLAAVLLLYDVLVVRGIGSLWPPKPREILGYFGRHGPFFAVIVGAIIVQSIKYETGFVHTKFGGMIFGARNPLRLLELSTLLLHWGGSWRREDTLLAMGAVFVALAVGLWLGRRRPEQSFLLLWAPLVLTPYTISNFRDGQTLGRYLYECSAVVFVLLALLVLRVVQWRPALRWPTLCLVFMLLSSFAAQVVQRIN